MLFHPWAIVKRIMSTNPDILSADYQALAEFRYQIRRFIRFSEQVARTAGIEPQQHQLLLAIKGLPPEKKATIGELAERLQLQHHSTVELVDRLSEGGFVERQRDEEDQRRVLVRLTGHGEELLQQISSSTLAELRVAGPMLVQALTKLIKDVNDETLSV
jgi:DNA-binding MarR family transcriptional regulator